MPVAIFGLFAASPARAEEDEIALTWDAPHDCPSREEVLAQVRRLTGPTSGADSLRAEVTVKPTTGGRVHAQIRTEAEGMSGSRVLEAASCPALSEAVVVLLALAADPYVLTTPRAPAPGATTPPRPALDPALAPRFAVAGAPRRPPTAAWHAHASLVGVGDIGAAAGPTLGLGVAAALTRTWFRAEVQGAISENRFVAAAHAPGAGALLGFISVTSRLCAGTQAGVASVGGCAGLEVVRVHGEGIGVSAPAGDAAAWAAPELGLWVRQLGTGRIKFYFGVAAEVPLRRPQGEISGVGAVFRPFAVTGQAALGVDVTIL